MSVVIIGGGIIGLSTAYYLSLAQFQPSSPSSTSPSSKPRIHIIDSAPSLFLSASGFAGGFIARDWYSSALAGLGEFSYRLHKDLAQKHDGSQRWGYSNSVCYSFSLDDSYDENGKKVRGEDWLMQGTSRSVAAPNSSRGGEGEAEVEVAVEVKGKVVGGPTGQDDFLNQDGTPAWITRQKGMTLETISSPDGCAQVEPRELGDFLLARCKEMGVEIHLSTTVSKVTRDKDGRLSQLETSKVDERGNTTTPGETIDCTSLVLTAGAWTPQVFKQLFPHSKTKIPVKPLAGHSMVFQTPRLPTPIMSPVTVSSPSRKGLWSQPQKAVATSHAIFATPSPSKRAGWKSHDEEEDKSNHYDWAPEIFSRTSSRSGDPSKPEIYIAGVNHGEKSIEFPDHVTKAKDFIQQDCMDELKRVGVIFLGKAIQAAEETPEIKPKTGESNSSGGGFLNRDRKEKQKASMIQRGINEDDLTIVRSGFCYRPASSRGVPVIGAIDDAQLGWDVAAVAGGDDEVKEGEDADSGGGGGGGVYIASGHGPWGISLSLGTGKIVSEMVQGKRGSELSADVSGLAL